MIPIGSSVRWHPDLGVKSDWVGVVTANPRPRMVECDGRGQISVGLLEVVGEMNENFMGHREIDSELARTLTAEVASLQAVIIAQAEAMAEMVPAPDEPDPGMQAKIEGYREWVADMTSYFEDYLSVAVGSARPVRPIEPVELRRLAEFIFEGVQ